MHRKGNIILVALFIILAALVVFAIWYCFSHQPSSLSATPSQSGANEQASNTSGSETSAKGTAGWQTFQSPGGISISYPANLYVNTSSDECGALFCLVSTQKQLVLGGACAPGTSATCTMQGYMLKFSGMPDYENGSVSGAFNINSYLARSFASGTYDNIKTMTIAGVPAYEFSFTGIASYDGPTIIIPSQGKLYQIEYTGSGAVNTALFEQIAGTLQFVSTTALDNFKETQGGPAWIEFSIVNANLLVTDSEGRKTGLISSSSPVVQQIPTSAYEGGGVNGYAVQLTITPPALETYHVKVIGMATSTEMEQLRVLATNGSPSNLRVITIKMNTQASADNEYTFQYTNTGVLIKELQPNTVDGTLTSP